jgi:hypothetical protein
MMRILLLNLGSASLEAAHSSLAGQGYEIAEESGRPTTTQGHIGDVLKNKIVTQRPRLAVQAGLCLTETAR